MTHNSYHGPAMTLGNMRENDVRSLSVTCELCRHEALMNMDTFDDATPVEVKGTALLQDESETAPEPVVDDDLPDYDE
jgi:hypothetical protein